MAVLFAFMFFILLLERHQSRIGVVLKSSSLSLHISQKLKAWLFYFFPNKDCAVEQLFWLLWALPSLEGVIHRETPYTSNDWICCTVPTKTTKERTGLGPHLKTVCTLKRWRTPVSTQCLRFIINKLGGKMCGPPRKLWPMRMHNAQKRWNMIVFWSPETSMSMCVASPNLWLGTF